MQPNIVDLKKKTHLVSETICIKIFFKCFKTTLYLNLCTDITNLLCNMDTLDSFLVSIENIKNTIHFYRSLFMKVSDLLTGRKI